jgi:hypothetical protein
MAITVASSFGSATASSGSVSPGSITPTQNSLIVVFAFEVTAGAHGTVSDNGVDGAGYTLLASVQCAGGWLTAWMRNELWGNVSAAGTIAYTGGGTGTAAAITIQQLVGANAPGGVCLLQHATNFGGTGAAPSAVFGSTPKASSAVFVCAAQRNSTAPTPPTAIPGGGLSESSTNISMVQNEALSNYGSATVTWGGLALAAWAAISLEIMNMGEGTDQGRPAQTLGSKSVGGWSYTFTAGSRRRIGEKLLIHVLQNNAIEIDVRLIDSSTGNAFLGLASQVVSQIRNPGGNFATFTPTSVTSRGNGHFSVVIPASATGVQGFNRLRFSTTPALGQPMAQPAEDYALDVSPVAGGQIKPNSMIDNYGYGSSGGSSGKATSWRLRVFASEAAFNAATAGNPDNTDGEIERYIGSATYNTNGTLASYGHVKVL